MSYILDALRRADSERERGAVPSLHSKQVAQGLADDDADASGRSVKPLWWAVGGLSVALVAVAVWVVMGRSEPETERLPERTAAAPVPPPPPAAVPQQPKDEPAAATTLPPPAAAMQAPTIERPRSEPPPSVPAPSPAPRAVAAAPRPAKPAEKPAAPAPSAREEEAHVPTMAELPDDVRRQLPPLTVSGASYSKNPSSRMLILNGQVFKEGDKIANDLALEQIRLKSAVLVFKGRRFSISY